MALEVSAKGAVKLARQPLPNQGIRLPDFNFLPPLLYMTASLRECSRTRHSGSHLDDVEVGGTGAADVDGDGIDEG